jgi:hemoglobin
VTKLAVLASALLLAACGGGGDKNKNTTTTAKKTNGKTTGGDDDKKTPGKDASLYDRLGGKAAITAVVDEFIGRVAADARINQRFFNTDIDKLKQLLVEQVCMVTGGPCKYSGQSMEDSHAGMELVDDEFTALVEDLIGALDKFKVPEKEKGELLGPLGGLKPAIVTPKERLKPVPDALVAKAEKVAKTITDKEAQPIMEAAVLAAKRGQRNYADQLFSRVEILVGAKTVAAAAPTFREGAPPRIDTPTKKFENKPQPKVLADYQADGPPLNFANPGSLKGSMTVDGKPLDGVGFIMLYPSAGGYPKRTAKVRVVEQRDKTFYPRLLAVPPGSTVAFPNFDGVYHNVFSISTPKKFDVGLYKDGEAREVKFDQVGLVRLGCNIHSKMASYIFVVDAPAYVVVEGDKPFKFNVLASGKYKAKAWSEHSATAVEADVVIKPGENTFDFDVKGDGESNNEDKFGMTRQTDKKK